MGFLLKTKHDKKIQSKLHSGRISREVPKISQKGATPRFFLLILPLLFVFSRNKNFSSFLSPPKKDINNQKKRLKKKINKLNTYVRQVLETTEKINYAQLLLKDLKPYLSTSVNRFTKFKLQELSDIIEEIQLDQIGFYMNTETELKKTRKNATFVYKET